MASPESQKILVIEDETEIRELIVIQAEYSGLVVDSVGTAEEGLQMVKKFPYSLIVLDWMLPGMSGIDFLNKFRNSSQNGKVPILMVTAKVEVENIVKGLEGGADDYLPKPFDVKVLNARIKALLRRFESFQKEFEQPSPKGELRVGELILNFEKHEVWCQGEEIQLTPSEFKLLKTLAGHRGRVLTRNSLIQEVQGEGVSVVGRTVDTHVFGLRKKLSCCSEIIETVRGVGYRVKYA